METVNTRDEGAVRIVELDRPEALNAFSSQLMDDLCDAFLDAQADESVKVLLLTGNGRAFSAGADLKEMGATDADIEVLFVDNPRRFLTGG